jgi:hypothetical protein
MQRSHAELLSSLLTDKGDSNDRKASDLPVALSRGNDSPRLQIDGA